MVTACSFTESPIQTLVQNQTSILGISPAVVGLNVVHYQTHSLTLEHALTMQDGLFQRINL